MTEYEENFITTYTGKKFHYLNPSPEEIDIVDIAHALSLSCRFRGHCKWFYSVAEHSVRVAEIVTPVFQLEALLHDAAEAYIPDIPRPIKAAFGMEEADKAICAAICSRYHLYEHASDYVHEADDIVGTTEARDLMHNTDGWARIAIPLHDVIHPWHQTLAERIFLDLFYTYVCMGVNRDALS